MVRTRWLAVVLGVLTYVVLALAGCVLGYLYTTRSDGGGPWWLEVFLGRPLNPFAGGFMGSLRVDSVLPWGLGLIVGLVVLVPFLVLGSRAGTGFATVVGGWLGSVLGSGLGGVVASYVLLTDASRGVDTVVADLGGSFYLSLTHGFYWGALVGWLVGAIALLGGVGGRRTS